MNPSQEAGLQREFKKIVDKADAEELALLKKYNNSFVAGLRGGLQDGANSG